MIETKRIIVITLVGLVLAIPAIGAPAQPDFSGTWKQSNHRCVPERTGDVTLTISHRDPELIVETTILRSSAAPRHAVQHYTTDGKISVSTGSDGDEFHTSIVWNEKSLIFSVEEHEDGRIILSRESWTLIEDGAALERVRELMDRSETQKLIYSRQVSSARSPL